MSITILEYVYDGRRGNCTDFKMNTSENVLQLALPLDSLVYYCKKRFPVISTTTYKTAQQIFRRGFEAHGKTEDFHKMQINTFLRNRFIHLKSQITNLWNSDPSYQSQEKKGKMLSWMCWSYALSHNTQGSSVERKDTEALLLNVVKNNVVDEV